MSTDIRADQRAYIFEKIAELAGISAAEIKDETTLDSLGLDSSDAVILAMTIQEALEREVDPSLFLRFNTIGEAAAEVERILGSA